MYDLVCFSYWLFRFLFFKTKTGYVMRISDWSSDVCSSDLQFINDMICLLDGPEQRDVQDKARALLKSRLTDMTAQKDELPPCPFCGNEPVLLTATEWDGFERYTEVRCDHCG